MRTEIQNWKYEDQPIRTMVDDEQQIWFAGIDVCNILEYADSYQAIMKLDEDERKLDRVRDGQGQLRETWTINEFGLYSLILTSTKSEAKAFKRWVTHIVLPSIRKAGLYTTEQEQNKELELQRISSELDSLENRISDAKSKVKSLTDEREKKFVELREVIKKNPNQLSLSLEKN